MYLRLLLGGVVVLLFATYSEAQYSNYSGTTAGAPDNPIARAAGPFLFWESIIVDYSPAPGVGPGFQNPQGGVASLGDLYSPVPRPEGIGTDFVKQYQPRVGVEPPFHAGATIDPFSGDINSTTDTYGFIGIDKPGSITVGFSQPIANGAGADFAVFENGFNFGGPTSLFAEFAHVEVSTNGVDFARFPSISLNTTSTAVSGTFQGYDVTKVYNLAGKHATNWGTPFNLDDLVNDSLIAAGLLDLNDINFVRLVDVIGSGELVDAQGGVNDGIDRDSLGNAILDNWVTFDSGGFDYLGLGKVVGVLNTVTAVPEPSSIALMGVASLGLFWRRRKKLRTGLVRILAVCGAFGLLGNLAFAQSVHVIDFEDYPLAGVESEFHGPVVPFTREPNKYAGDDLVGMIQVGEAQLVNRFSEEFGSWSGFAISNTTDTTTAGYLNQFSAITGGGADNSQYAVAFGYHDIEVNQDNPIPFDRTNPLHLRGLPTIHLPTGSAPLSVDITNTTYAVLSMEQGDSFAKAFGGASGSDPDYFTLYIFGTDLSGNVLANFLEVQLADFRFADNSQDFILKDWLTVDLAELETAASLHFNLLSSDVGDFGMNTPAYFAMDNLTVSAVPEPSSIVLIGLIGGALAMRRSRRGLPHVERNSFR